MIGDLGFVIRILEKKKDGRNVAILLHSMQDNTVLVIIMKKKLVQVRTVFKKHLFVSYILSHISKWRVE